MFSFFTLFGLIKWVIIGYVIYWLVKNAFWTTAVVLLGAYIGYSFAHVIEGLKKDLQNATQAKLSQF